ncbi:MAG: hypothetical protein AAB427_00105, partial [Chloroflexota bacterium]
MRTANGEWQIANRELPVGVAASRGLFALRIAKFGIWKLGFGICIFFIASCASSGVSNLAATGGHIAVISRDDLYVISNTEPDIAFYAFRPDTRFAPALTPDGKSVIYVDISHRLLRQPLDGTSAKVLWPPPGTRGVGLPGPGALAFLPNGDLFFLDTRSNDKRYVMIMDTETGVVSQQIEDIEQVFVTSSALKPKPAPSLASARIEAGEPGQFRVVFQAKTFLYLYSATADGFVFDGQLPRVLSVEDQIFLTRRVENDVTSGLLTADGKHVILRLRVRFDRTQSLYALDLTSDAPPVPLVEDAPGHPDYAVAPDGDWVAYEETVDGVPQVQIYNVVTGEKRTMGVGAVDPGW